MLATQRPEYLSKEPEQKFWEVQVEYTDRGGDRCCSFNIFCSFEKAQKFAKEQQVPFLSKGYYSTVLKEKRRRATKHF